MDYNRLPEGSVLFVLNYTKYITDKARKIWLEVGHLVFSCRFRKRVSDVDVVAGDTDVGFIFNGHLGDRLLLLDYCFCSSAQRWFIAFK